MSTHKNIQLSDHFSYTKLIRFTLPSVVMMIFISIYSVVDGFFVAKFVGETPFAAVNIVWPFVMLLGSIGFMLGSGGSALVAKTLGEGHAMRANRIFSLLIYTTILCGMIFAIAGVLSIKSMLRLFHVENALMDNCLTYAYILMPTVPALMLQVIFHTFLVTAERPKLGLLITVTAGIINFALDALFILIFKWGLSGAALATAASQIIGGIVPLIYFILPNKSRLHLGKTKLYWRAILKSGTNGISEFLSNISAAVVGLIYNYQLLKLVGEDGVIAFGVITYVNFIFLASFIGYAVGSNPIVSYHFGADNKAELQNILHKSLRLITASAILLTLCAQLSAPWIAQIFVGQNINLVNMTIYGFRIYAVSFLLAGINIYASAFFTALNNGFISAVISFSRTMIFECLCVIILPIFWHLNGIWAAIIVAEILSLAVSVGCLCRFKQRYGY